MGSENKLITNYFCPLCYYKTPIIKNIRTHVIQNRHHPIICQYCEKTFISLYTCSSHSRTDHKGKKLKYHIFNKANFLKDYDIICYYCMKIFRKNEGVYESPAYTPLWNTSVYKLHHRDYHINLPELFYLQNDCINKLSITNDRFTDQTNFDEREGDCDTINFYYKCNHCHEYFECIDLFKAHKVEKYSCINAGFWASFPENDELIKENELPIYVCIKCGNINFTFQEAKYHFYTHNLRNFPFMYVYQECNKEPTFIETECYSCTLCTIMPNSYEIIKLHWYKNHPHQRLKLKRLYPNFKETFRCYKCEINFKSVHHLILHEKFRHQAIATSSVLDPYKVTLADRKKDFKRRNKNREKFSNDSKREPTKSEYNDHKNEDDYPDLLPSETEEPSLTNRQKNTRGRKSKKMKVEAKKDKANPSSLHLKGDLLFYKCVECKKWFNTYDDLRSHQLVDHDSKDRDPFVSRRKNGKKIPLGSLARYFCLTCNFETFTLGEVKLHRQDHEDSDQIVRYLLLEQGATDVILVEENTYSCTRCDIMPDILSTMEDHWKESHQEHPLKITRLYNDGNPLNLSRFSCDQCLLKFPLVPHLDLHKKLKHGKESVNPRH